MGKLMILNASPRAPKSNSKQYAGLFEQNFRSSAEYYEVRKSNHGMLCEKIESFSDVLLVFPLYADGIPATLLNFLKTLEKAPLQKKPVISVMINCGFIEPEQNDVAVEMVRLFCRMNGFPFGSVLKIGSGEAILSTPFRIFLKAKMKKLADSIISRKYGTYQVTMPVPKWVFLKASSVYWENYGRRSGITKEEMKVMEIEKE